MVKTGLIKKGTPHPRDPTYKFDSAHLTDKEADKVDLKYVKNPKLGVDATRRLVLPKQHLVFTHKGPRITPKRPKLRR